ncbi:hypothetical protein TSUD_337390 [Trifolium subterraneum]|uniref:DUF7086 domain-containing protein n=1 Tax=Trifolium subterraneum TaxID=3900 RepID=A0A2Z6NYW7_TRISU|nr:hypothetical protein TSUD_337390 [Trifolium subterraneum]
MVNHTPAGTLSCDALWFTLSQTSSSSSSSSSPSPPSQPRPSPFEYTPLTPPTRLPIHPQTTFPLQIISPTQQHSKPYPDLSQEKDSHQEKQEPNHVSLPNPITSTSNKKVLGRRQCSQSSSCPAKRRKLKSETVPPPFPWTTSKRATVHTLDHLLSELKLKTISGTLQCKFCKFQQDIQFDLVEKFQKVTKFIEENIHEMHDRAPDAWNNPVLPRCERCGKEKAMEPLITKKRNINWLFMLLGEMIGCCKIKHLKYFCKHNDIHRTAARNRLIYLTYLGLCKQLQPERPFNL